MLAISDPPRIIPVMAEKLRDSEDVDQEEFWLATEKMLISLPAVMVTSLDVSLAPIRLVLLPEVREMSPLAFRLAMLLVRDSEPLVEIFAVVEPVFQFCDSE